ncbi:rCG44208 [Rattus norvegicus]|uniref:RCG44208 n=1 Tax=Rattus norvegicus TaxID=10116 RepID=A6J6U7_RAT|nr:rCG44208 [Rattus norvegicus]
MEQLEEGPSIFLLPNQDTAKEHENPPCYMLKKRDNWSLPLTLVHSI